jgi:hypothetical protein
MIVNIEQSEEENYLYYLNGMRNLQNSMEDDY